MEHTGNTVTTPTPGFAIHGIAASYSRFLGGGHRVGLSYVSMTALRRTRSVTLADTALALQHAIYIPLAALYKHRTHLHIHAFLFITERRIEQLLPLIKAH